MKIDWRVPLFLVLAVAIVLVLSHDANAQCSMCKAVVSGSNNGRFIRNLNIGVLVLLLPPVSIFCSIFVVLRRYRNSDQASESHSDSR